MGVTYKLKQEVVDYILELKHVDQRLSCRKISELASTHFQKPISKSSVNAVIKESLLSSPVGRRAKPESRGEKFKIPEHRKEQIFINIPLSLLGEKPLPPQATRESPTRIENVGIFFLKAAEWQVKRQGILRFFCEKFGPLLCDEKILKLAEAFLFMPLFGEQSSEKFVDLNKKDLWQINDIEFEPTVYQKKECYDTLFGLEPKATPISFEYGQAFSEASFFRFVLEDNTCFCVDAQKNAIWEENNVHCDFSLCLDKNFDFLSKEFLVNSDPIIFRQAAVSENLSAGFLNMVSCFENLPGKRIRSVDVMTSKKEPISSFEKLVGKKRYYITGLYGCRGLLDQIAPNTKKELQHIDDKLTHQSYYYWEAATAFRLPTGQQIAATIALVSEKKDASPAFAVLTNVPSDVMPTGKIVSAYLEKWPHPLQGQALFSERQKTTQATCCDIVSFPDEKEVLLEQKGLLCETHFLARLTNTVLLGLHDHCARHFFDPAHRSLSLGDARKIFYGLAGNVKKEHRLLKVKCVLPEGYAHQKELAHLVQRVNESFVRDPKDHRLFIEI